ncbi:hypothetical protein UC35_05140 [Ramlibacter tataouinensis]|uniref:Uncharacterized protein n=1 Tax=Ramlibacter tataouinensis TaxID=94132 RepID=A0A127JR08_9BURK|nr:hypothetical protein UC35_05140 [Ramlibacter tataouinensis]
MAATRFLASPPRRRWSDGPQYPWSPATEDEWSLVAHWPALAGVLCEEVARGSSEAMRELDRLCAQDRMSRTDAASIRRSLVAMRATGLAMQQIVRLGSGRWRASPDRVDLSGVIRAALRERQRDLAQAGIEVGLDLHGAQVWIDVAVAAALIGAAIDWALSFSTKLWIKVDAAPTRIVVRASLPGGSEGERRRNRRMNDNLQWVLLRQLAACARVAVSRSSSAATESAVIEFPASITLDGRRVG